MAATTYLGCAYLRCHTVASAPLLDHSELRSLVQQALAFRASGCAHERAGLCTYCARSRTDTDKCLAQEPPPLPKPLQDVEPSEREGSVRRDAVRSCAVQRDGRWRGVDGDARCESERIDCAAR